MVTSNEVAEATQHIDLVANTRLQELDKVLITNSKEDYITPLSLTKFSVGTEGYKVAIPLDRSCVHVKDLTCSKLFLTKYLTELGGNGLVRYARLMHSRQQFDLLVENVNRQIQEVDKAFMVRTHRPYGNCGNEADVRIARALLSPSFKRLDDDFVFPVVAKALESVSGPGYLEFIYLGGRNTGEKTYARYVSKDPVLFVGKREIRIGFQVTNSEVGMSGFVIEFFLCDDFCENGMIFGKEGLDLFYMKHSGKRMRTIVPGIMSHDPFITQHERYDMEVKIQDRIFSMVSPNMIDSIKNVVECSFDRKFYKDPEDVIEKFGTFYELTADEIELAKQEFIEGENHAYGLQAAITKAGQQSLSFDRRSELDRIGGKIVEQSDAQWENLILAA